MSADILAKPRKPAPDWLVSQPDMDTTQRLAVHTEQERARIGEARWKQLQKEWNDA